MGRGPMIPVCLSFQAHQPWRLRRYNYFDVGREHRYFDEAGNCERLQKVAARCYRPATAMLERLLGRHERFHAAVSMSGTLLEQLAEFAPDVRDAFRRLAATGRVEFLAGTSHHSLAWLASREEFAAQVALHRRQIVSVLGAEPRVFRDTERIYSDALAGFLEELGFAGVLADGLEPLLHGRTPRHLYRAATPGGLPLLVRDDRLSGDVASRFSNRLWSEWPLTAEKYESWVSHSDGELVSLFMELETFGERGDGETGLLEFFEEWVGVRLQRRGTAFLTPSEAIARVESRGALSAPRERSRTDGARDHSGWQDNDLQRDALNALFALEARVKASGSEALLSDFRRLTTSDHFCCMATRPAADAGGQASFSPYASPHEAYIVFMNVVSDLERRVPRRGAARRAASPRRPAPRL